MVWVTYIFICVFVAVANCELLEVKFYSKELYYDKLDVDAKVSNEDCSTLPTWAWNKAKSVKFSKCLMLFTDADCQGRSYELPAKKGYKLPFFNNDIVSFRVCKSHEIGRSNNWVDNDLHQETYDNYPTKSLTLYRSKNHEEILWDTVIKPHCVTLEKWSFGRATSIKTDECVVLYSKEHCKGYSLVVDKGNMTWLSYFNDQTASFRPCTKESILGEPKLSFVVTKFELFKAHGVSQQKARQYFKHGSYTNNGTTEFKQPFEESFEFREKTSTEFAEMSSSAHDVSLSRTVEVQGEIAVPLMAKTKVAASLTTAYEYRKEKGITKTKKNETTEKIMVKVGTEITVPPCTHYEAKSFAKVMMGFPVRFLSEMEVTGKQGERQMTADEVKSKLSSKIKFLRNKDGNTVIAQGEGISKTDFGIETGVYGNGRPLAECIKA